MTYRLVRAPLIDLKLKHLLMMLCMMALLGCVAPGLEINEDPISLARAPADLSPWTATGKLAVTAGQETHTARFEWQRHDLAHDTVTVSGPFSMNRVVLEREGATLIWRDGENIRPLSEAATLAPTLRLLTARHPETFGQWLLGYPGSPEQGHIEVLSWQPMSPWRLPERMIVSIDGYTVKIRVSTWEISAPL